MQEPRATKEIRELLERRELLVIRDNRVIKVQREVPDRLVQTDLSDNPDHRVRMEIQGLLELPDSRVQQDQQELQDSRALAGF